ncbi:hypothetical protein CALCODRAFT_557818 [Calocera cornea HHB12733]|uniref:Uncharacterized protein n=1 Tax=Calocera cornea HHB12733 TaxID=1353952 RepID=A0A165DIJ8_9BASI|nr:hypothetical protein CALCODRAFT_557818 [Calocera cornea HHB12733]
MTPVRKTRSGQAGVKKMSRQTGKKGKSVKPGDLHGVQNLNLKGLEEELAKKVHKEKELASNLASTSLEVKKLRERLQEKKQKKKQRKQKAKERKKAAQANATAN